MTVRGHRLAVPGASVAQGVEGQLPAQHHLVGFGLRLGVLLASAQNGPDALEKEALAERLLDEVIGAEGEAEDLVDLLILGGEEDDRKTVLFAQGPQQLKAVHSRHFDVENGELRHLGVERRQGGRAIVNVFT